MTEPTYLPLADIEATVATQARVRLSPDSIDEYAICMANGDIFPPVVVFVEEGSERNVLADGFHRVAAAKKAGREEITVDLRNGDVHMARRFALTSNRSHGLRRTRADKQKAVEMALTDPFFDEKTNPQIAEYTGVSKEMVRQARQEMNEPKPATGKVAADNSAAGNTRQPAKALTQSERDRADLIEILKSIRAYPYDGTAAVEEMGLDDELYDEVDYCAEWLGSLAEEMEKAGDGGS